MIERILADAFAGRRGARSARPNPNPRPPSPAERAARELMDAQAEEGLARMEHANAPTSATAARLAAATRRFDCARGRAFGEGS